jgi:PAS domain S-box-containing protein
MADDRTEEQLLVEIARLNRRVHELEKSEAEGENTKKQEALQKSEEDLRFISDNMTDVIGQINAEGIITYFSPSLKQLTGYDPLEIVGKGSSDLVHPEDQEKVLNAIQDGILTKKPITAEYRTKISDGGYLWVESKGKAVYDANGNFQSAVFVVRDISDRKKAEEALKSSESFLNAIIDQSPTAIWISDSEGNLIRINQACLELLNISAEDVIGKYNIFRDNLVEEQGFMPLIESVFEKGQSVRFEIVYDSSQLKHLQLENFASVYLDVTVFPVKDSEGNVNNVVLQHIDITERKKMEEALRASEEKYKTLFESDPDYTILVGLEGIILDFNAAAEQIIGKSKEELVGKHFLELGIFPEEELGLLKESFSHLTKNGDVAPFESRIIDKNGDIRWGETVLTIIKKDNVPAYILVISSDITEHKKAKDKLKESERSYRALVDNSLVGIFKSNLQGDLLFANEAIFKMMHYESLEDLKEGNILSVYKNPEDRLQLIQKLEKEGRITDYELEAVGKNGESVNVLMSASLKDNELSGMFMDITDRKKSENLLKKVMDVAPYGAFHYELHPDGRLIFKGANKSADLILGLDCTQFIGKTIEEAFPMLSETEIPDAYKRVAALGETYETEQVEYDEQRIVGIFEIHAINTGENKMTVFFRDVTEAKKAENKLKSSLKEKEILLTEVHHRVKNNMQIISSLLNLQKNYAEGDESLNIIRESQNRVKSMAMIHEKLYKSGKLTHINIEDYIQSLVSDLFYSYHVKKSQINPITEIDDIKLNLETAIPCGLIINEIISNSLKYAFTREEPGEIKISLRKHGPEYELIISDNGIGLPEDVDFKKTDSLGLQLVNSLVDQLDGEIELDRRHGTQFKINFRELEYKTRI